MQHAWPLLPLLLLHIPSYKKLPSHPREVSASPQSTQQRWGSGQESTSPTSCKSFLVAWATQWSGPTQTAGISTFGYVCPMSSHGVCQKHINAVPLTFFRKLEMPNYSHWSKLLNGIWHQVHKPWKINSSTMPPAVPVLPPHQLQRHLTASRVCNSTPGPSNYIPESQSKVPRGSSRKPASVSQALQTLKKDWRRQRWTRSDTPLQGWCLFWCTAVLGVSLFYQLLRSGTLWYSSCSHCASRDAMFQHVGGMPNPCVTRSSPRES